MTDEQIEMIKMQILASRIQPDESEQDEREARDVQRKQWLREKLPLIIFVLSLVAFAFLFSFSDESIRRKILEALFLQHLLSH